MIKVLIVDDEPEAAEIVAMFLEAKGHQARMATSQRTAIELGISYRPDVLITDYILEDGDGTEVARAIAAVQPRLRVMVVSGLLPDDVRGKDTSLYDIRMKPVDLDEIARYVGLELRAS